MQVEEVQTLLQSNLPECDVVVDGDGQHFFATVVGDVFFGKNRVERQKIVYAAAGEKIKSGEIHALSIETYTVLEYQDKKL